MEPIASHGSRVGSLFGVMAVFVSGTAMLVCGLPALRPGKKALLATLIRKEMMSA